MVLRAPVLSELNEKLSAEGGIDPLSLARTYERLANRVLPALTVRMSRPRFLTAMAVGARVCEDYDDDDVAADGVTPPWLVYEWYVLWAFVTRGDTGGHAIPGVQKARTAFGNKRPLSTSSYLKTPTVFGFHGVYKTLARGLRILTDDMRLDEGGYELLSVWEREQGLDGFSTGAEGDGTKLRTSLRKLVADGMAKGATGKASAPLRRQLAAILWPDAPGKNEATLLASRLSRSEGLEDGGDPAAASARAEIVRSLEAGGQAIDRAGEPAFLRSLRGTVSDELDRRLRAIDDYESLCRPIQDAFDLLLYLGGTLETVSAAEFAGHELTSSLFAASKTGANRILDNAVLLEWEPDARGLAERYAGIGDGGALFDAMLEHHAEAQARKPPHGKRPWIVRARKGRAFVRAAYRLPAPPARELDYAHDYRLATLSQFLTDLGRLP